MGSEVSKRAAGRSPSGFCRVRSALEILAVWVASSACGDLASSVTGGMGRPVHGLEHAAHYAVAVPLLLVAVTILLRLRGERLADIGLRRPERGWRRAIGIGLASGLLIHSISYPVAWGLQVLGLSYTDSVFDVDEWSSRLGFFISGPLAGGFGEELLFRGFLLSRFERLAARAGQPRFGTAVAVVATSAWFGWTHVYQGALGAVAVGLIGLAFAGLYLACRRNLIPVMIAHATVDELAFAALIRSA